MAFLINMFCGHLQFLNSKKITKFPKIWPSKSFKATIAKTSPATFTLTISP